MGVDVDDGEVELRSLMVTDFTDRGVRLRSNLVDRELDCLVAGCDISRNGADGLSGLGAFDLRIDGSRFDANVQEGIELDDLVSLPGIEATQAI